ncbi:40S ribosomal protein S21 isoform X1 [Thalassophryne amazonica]|uniref:40S ribosomal protein S21 isoform X1 n=2 Tax=Thalassophryne amazonica TaxID=390379 RepID=UPI001471CD19|nr:40S ribosomal protein S21 isoform X1 [Thalassophryne amazonica]
MLFYFRVGGSSSFLVGRQFQSILLQTVCPTANMQNDAGEFVDLYVPRKCSASNRIIGAKDHASIQINIAEVDKLTGRFNGQFKTYAICGAIRRMGEADDSILRLAKNDNIVAKNF